MIAYKFLHRDGTAVFSGFTWPIPTNGRAGRWVEAPVDPCRSGVHACRPGDLPYWAGEVLYEIELEGEIVEQRSKVVAARGRILRRVDAWDEAAAEEYTRRCADRAHELALAADRSIPDWARPLGGPSRRDRRCSASAPQGSPKRSTDWTGTSASARRSPAGSSSVSGSA